MVDRRPVDVAHPGGRVIDAGLGLLDRQLIDADGIQAGKVDDIELHESEDGSLVATAIVSGPGALAPRLGGRLSAAWRAAIRRLTDDEAPHRWPFEVVTKIESAVHLGVSAEHLDVNPIERAARQHLIAPLPGVTVLLSDLIGVEVFDREGACLGAVRDVRLVQDAAKVGMVGAGFRVQGLVVGKVAFSTRLGYDRHDVRGPWLVAKVANWLHRESRFVPWDAVTGYSRERITIRAGRDELEPPIAIPDLQEPA